MAVFLGLLLFLLELAMSFPDCRASNGLITAVKENLFLSLVAAAANFGLDSS